MGKVEYMGRLINGWKKVILREVIEESKVRNINKKEYPVLSISNVHGFVIQNEYFSHNIHSVDLSKYKIIYKNYFAYNPARINIGSIALNENFEEGLLSPMYIVFKVKKGLYPKYLSYFIQTYLFNFQVLKNVMGSVRESLNYSFLELFDFYLPENLSEQQKIAEILGTADNVIEKTDKIIEKYKRIKRGLMQDLLTRGIDENGQIRREKTHKFKDSPLGRIPEEWEVVRLGEANSKLDYGYTESADSEEVGPKFLRITDIQNNIVNWEEVPFCNINVKDLKRYILKTEDIMFARTGATTGKSFYIENPPFAIFASYLIRIRFEYNVNPKFISYFFNTTMYWHQINLDLAGSTQEGFNASKLKKILIPLPPLFEQHRIASILSQIDETIEKEQEYKEKLESIKQGLMEDLLTGKVRVNNLIDEAKYVSQT